MSILAALNRNHAEAHSEIFSHISDKAFNETTISNMQAWISKKSSISMVIYSTRAIAITAVACAAIAYLPKIIALGIVAFLAVTYHKVAKETENDKKNLLLTIENQKVIEYLSDPDLNKKALASLDPYKNDDILKEIQSNLHELEESPSKKILLEKYEQVLANQKKINETLFYLKTKVSLETLEGESPSKRNLENTLKFVRGNLDTAPLDSLFEDSIPLLKDIDKNNHILREIQEILGSLEGGSFFKKDLLNLNITLLKEQERLSKKLRTLQVNRSFFKKNGDLLKKIVNVFLKADFNFFNQSIAYRNNMFYSLTGVSLIKIGLFFNKGNWANRGILLHVIHNPFLLIGLGGCLFGAYAVKNVLTLLAHRNDQKKEQMEWKKFSEDEKIDLVLLMNQW